MSVTPACTSHRVRIIASPTQALFPFTATTKPIMRLSQQTPPSPLPCTVPWRHTYKHMAWLTARSILESRSDAPPSNTISCQSARNAVLWAKAGFRSTRGELGQAAHIVERRLAMGVLHAPHAIQRHWSTIQFGHLLRVHPNWCPADFGPKLAPHNPMTKRGGGGGACHWGGLLTGHATGVRWGNSFSVGTGPVP